MICLDTNAVIAVLTVAASPVTARVAHAVARDETVAVSPVVVFELWYGVTKSGRKDWNAARLADFLAGPIDVLDFDTDDGREAALIRAGLEQRGTPIGPYDLLIAAQARRRDALLVTAKLCEFNRVEGLRVENWLEQ
jgi:tRNA(fMet)-specific endonuclease VapC